MLKNEITGSSTILKEVNHQLSKTSSSCSLILGIGAKPKHVTTLENSFKDMTVTSSNYAAGEIPAPDGPSEDKANNSDTVVSSKELHQSMVDTARQLDLITSKINTVEGLFAKEILEQRRKLKALCEQLLFEDPKKYGVIARDRIWRSVFYDVICRAKRLKKASTFTPIQQIFVKNHLLSGVGQMNILVMKLQVLPEFKKAKFRFVNGNLLKISDELSDNQELDLVGDENDINDWLLDILYMCLINSGDLYRYLTDIFYKDADAHAEYFDHAMYYYSEAFLLNPTFGLAHNQLGNLSLKLNDGLDSTYYLLYSMCTANAYNGAYQNLKQLLDGQLVHLATMPAVAELNSIDTFAHTFLGLIYHLLCTDGTHLTNFEKSCKEALLGFYDLLNSNEKRLEKQLYFRVAVISVMTVWRLQAIDSNYVSTAVAFASGLFLNLTNYLSAILKDKSTRMPKVLIRNSIEECSTKSDHEETEEVELDLPSHVEFGGTDLFEDNNFKGEVVKVKVAKRRRRRRRRRPRRAGTEGFPSSSDEDESSGDAESDRESEQSDLNALSDESASSYESDSSSSEEEIGADRDDKQPNESNGVNGDKCQNYEESISSSNDYYSDGSSIKKIKGQSDSENQDGIASNEEKFHLVLTVNDLLACASDVEPVLVAMVPYIRWFKSAPLIVTAFISNCGSDFMQNICDIMNIFGTIDWNPRKSSPYERNDKPKAELVRRWQSLLKIEDQAGADCEEILLELAEDRSLLGLPDFVNDLKRLKTDADLSLCDKILIRVRRILAFGHWLASVEGIALKYSKESDMFTVETAKNEKFYNQARRLKDLRDRIIDGSTTDANHSWGNSRKSRRRRDVENQRQRRLPPRLQGRNRGDANRKKETSNDDTIYVLCDLPAMLYHFDTIRRLAMYSKFLIVLPFPVHTTIDKLKNTEEEGSKEARVAALWIEEQNERGGIRLLRRGDHLSLNFEYPEPQTDASKEFIDVLETCNYFRLKDNKEGRPATKFYDDVRDKYRILYLSGHLDLLKPQYRSEFNAKEIAQTAHIFVDRVTFYAENQGRQMPRKRRRYKGKG